MSIEQPSKQETDFIDETFVKSADVFLDELSSLSDRGVDRQAFYEFLTQRMQVLIGARNTCVAVRGPAGQWVSAFKASQIKDSDWLLSNRFEEAVDAGEAVSFDAGKGLVLAVPVVIESEDSFCIVAVFESMPHGSWVQIYKDLIATSAEIAAGFERRQLVRKQDDRFSRLESFVHLITNSHSSLDLETAGYNLANDGRHLLSADRVWIFTSDGRVKPLACSTVTSVNERTKSFVALRSAIEQANSQGLSDIVVNSQSDCPPALTALAGYLQSEKIDGFYAVRLQRNQSDQALGFFVAEFLHPHDSMSTISTIKNLLPSIQSAVSNADAFSGLPLRRSMQTIRRLTDQFRLNALPRTVTALAMLGVVLAALMLIKTDFEVTVKGQLRPTLERQVFAPADSIVDQVLVEYGQSVKQGESVLQLSSNEYESKVSELQNELSAVQKELEANELLQSAAGNEGRDSLFVGQVTAKIEQNRLQIEAVQKNIQWYLQRQQELEITAPIDGVVITRDLKLNLMKRTIGVGSRLLTIADTDSQWEIQFEVPDREFGYLLDAKRHERIEAWDVKYRFESDLSEELGARIGRCDEHNSMDENGQSFVKAYVPFEKSEADHNHRVGQSVVGKVNCGKRSLFFIWTRDVRDFLRSNFFWM